MKAWTGNLTTKRPKLTHVVAGFSKVDLLKSKSDLRSTAKSDQICGYESYKFGHA